MLRSLTDNIKNHVAIVSAGALHPLVALVHGGNPVARGQAAWTLGSLARMNANNQLAIVSAGAIDPLVVLVRSGSAEAQAHAAWTLGNLAHTSAENQVAIVSAGAIEPLVALMRSGSVDAQEQATGCCAVSPTPKTFNSSSLVPVLSSLSWRWCASAAL